MIVSDIIYLERDGIELEIKVTGDYIPFVPGKYFGPPEKCYPDSGGWVEITSAIYNEEEIELTKNELEYAEEKLIENLKDRH